jgi:hypothetical protein
MTAPTLIDRHLSHYGAAGVLGCARQTVLAYAARGLLTPCRVGGRLFFLTAEVEELRDRLAVESAPTRKAPKQVRGRA